MRVVGQRVRGPGERPRAVLVGDDLVDRPRSTIGERRALGRFELAALRDAMAKVNQLQSGALGGLDLGGLKGLLGGALPQPGDGD